MKTIEISKNVKIILDKIKNKNESYNSIIEEMIEDEQELNKKTIEELKIARRGQSHSHSEIKERFRL